MTEISKDFLKLIATLIVVLTIFLVVLNSGILESLFALKTYAEPLTLLDHLAAAIETASSCPGKCSQSVRTSGLPYILQIYKKNGNYYASIDASLVEEKSNVKFLPNQQQPVFTKPLVSDCIISEQKLALTEGLIQDITIDKVIEADGTCKVFIESKEEYYDFNVSVYPDTLLVLNGTSSTTTVTVSLIGSQIAPGPVSLTVMGVPNGVTVTFDKDNANPTFTSTMTITADPTATQGIYNLTIMGTSGSLARTASLQIEVSPTLYTFILNSEINIFNLPLTNVGVNLSGITKYTRPYDNFTSNIIYSMLPGSPYSVKVDDPFADPQGPRSFSHFRDFDCGGNNTGYILDTGSNPYSFGIPNNWTLVYSRKMTAFYKVFTQIRNLEFDNVTNIISGNLLDEDFNPIANETTIYNTCGVPTQLYFNRNATIEYLDTCSNTWKMISSARSSSASAPRFYDNFDSGDYNQWTTTPTWNVTDGNLNNTGAGGEWAQTKWNYWNGSSGENNNLEVSVNLLSGNNVSIRIFDAINEYYIETNDSYKNVYLWVNGALKKNASINATATGIRPNQWNIWKIRQNESHVDFYINNIKLIRYDGVPLMNFGRMMIRTLNTRAMFDNVSIYSGLWSYKLSNVFCSMKKIGAAYVPSDWYYNESLSSIDIDPATNRCKLTVNTWVDINERPLPKVEVNVSDGFLNKSFTNNTTGPSAIAYFLLAATPLPIDNITVNNTFYSRNFSHYWDHDCDPINVGYYSDNASNPYWFNICRDKNITVQYKAFTNITNFNFNFSINNTISGKLLDEFGNSIVNKNGTKHTFCTPQNVFDNYTINRNVSLEYFKNNTWYYINNTDSKADGSWSYNWNCACNATKLRANYTPLPENWYYMPNSTVINITCPCKLTVIAQIDALTVRGASPLRNVKVNVGSMTNWTDVNGTVEFYLFPGNYTIKVDNPFLDPLGFRNFSHYWDQDCSKTPANRWLDSASNPYNFSIYDRDRNITAQYKAFVNITNTSGLNIFEYNGTYIKGRLVDEKGNSLLPSPKNKHVNCEDSSINNNNVPVNRNVTLEYFNSSNSRWYYIGSATVNPVDNVSWSYPWNWFPSATKLRANYTPLPDNWYYMPNSTEIPLNKLTVFASLDLIGNPPIANVNVTYNGNMKNTDASGKAEFLLSAVNNVINVINPFSDSIGPRNFSHYWDSDCDGSGNYLDKIGSPLGYYSFTSWNKDRIITAYYRTFTNITNITGTSNTFGYDGKTVSGKLIDEKGNIIKTSGFYHPNCGPALSPVPVNRNVILEVYNSTDGKWYYIGTNDSSTVDGSWSYDYSCGPIQETLLRATYSSSSWYYNSTVAQININHSLCSRKLSVFAFEDISGLPLGGVQVVVDGLTNTTDSSGETEFTLTPGPHSVTVDLLTDGFGHNRFSHYWDSDCHSTNLGWYYDTNGLLTSGVLGKYNFVMYGRDRILTAYYEIFTNISDTAGNMNTFEYDGANIKGRLVDRRGSALASSKNYHPSCESPSTVNVLSINRNIYLEYYNSNDGIWHPIGTATVNPVDNMSWSFPWATNAPEVTKLRASYSPSNWFYTYTEVTLPLYTLTFNAQVDVTGTPLDITVSVDGITKTTAGGTFTCKLTPGSHLIMAPAWTGSNSFSHFADFDCDPNFLNYVWDSSADPFPFTIYNRDRSITVQYTSPTYIENTARTPNTFEYDGTTIKGRLADEYNNPIVNPDGSGHGFYHLSCGLSASTRNINRDVSLEYYSGSSWTVIPSASSDSSGLWQQAWSCTSGATQLRATYTPVSDNWWYTGTSVVINVNCPPPSCGLDWGGICTTDLNKCHSVYCGGGICAAPSDCVAPNPCCCDCFP